MTKPYKTTGAIVVRRHGPPEVLEWDTVALDRPEAGEVLMRHTAVGLNFIDAYHREGLYPLGLPFIPGVEGAGVIEEVGPGVADFKQGDRVAYTGNGPPGSYTEWRVLPAGRLVRLPDAIDDIMAAGLMLKGCTVEYLIRRTFSVRENHWVLWHAAAGGVGLIACQWLNAIGAQVIGTVGSTAKAELAQQHGCHHVILYRQEDVVARVKEITGGDGVDVVYDSVGKDTFAGSLDVLRPRGMLVSFGNASGAVDPFPPLLLSQKGSLFLTRPSLGHYYSEPREFRDGCEAVFDAVVSGMVVVPVRQTVPLREAARAHTELQARRTTGATVFTVAG
ncbi:MAG: quinone oxidoreductase [Gemmatimonadota bacterium]|nr:MAG: quinone oxidoreductase [Gemmatimonadota bacterium]